MLPTNEGMRFLLREETEAGASYPATSCLQRALLSQALFWSSQFLHRSTLFQRAAKLFSKPRNGRIDTSWGDRVLPGDIADIAAL